MARRRFGGVTEQRKASGHRRDDAEALLQAGRYRGAMYLAGYAVECLLKVRLMERFGQPNLRALEEELQRRGLLAAGGTAFTHQLGTLLTLTGSRHRLEQDRNLWPLFNVVNGWEPAWRHNPDLADADEAGDYLRATDSILRWIANNVRPTPGDPS